MEGLFLLPRPSGAAQEEDHDPGGDKEQATAREGDAQPRAAAEQQEVVRRGDGIGDGHHGHHDRRLPPVLAEEVPPVPLLLEQRYRGGEGARWP